MHRYFFEQDDLYRLDHKQDRDEEPRDYLRGSDMGAGCLRSAVLNMVGGVQKRPEHVDQQIRWARGPAWERFIIPRLQRYLMVDYIEGVPQFEDSEELMRTSVEEAGRFLRWDWPDRERMDGKSGRPEKDFHFWYEHNDQEYEIHFRPDCIIRGLRNFRTNEYFPWPRDRWVIVDAKCKGGKFGIQKMKRSVRSDYVIDGWYESYIQQLTTMMHFLGLNEAVNLVGQFEFFGPGDVIWDGHQKAWRGRGAPIPEFPWKTVEYDPQWWASLADKGEYIRRLLTHYREHGNIDVLPMGCDHGSEFYKGCPYNAQTVCGTNSGPMCRGRIVKKEK
jgi:hypothetical protein